MFIFKSLIKIIYKKNIFELLFTIFSKLNILLINHFIKNFYFVKKYQQNNKLFINFYLYIFFITNIY